MSSNIYCYTKGERSDADVYRVSFVKMSSLNICKPIHLH